jgi:hypothetical protein
MEDKHQTSVSTRVEILHHAKLVSEVLILHSRQRLGENACYFLICGYVSELQSSFMHHVSDVVVFDITLLCSLLSGPYMYLICTIMLTYSE